MEATGHISSSDDSYYSASENDDWISNPASQSALDDKISDVDFDVEERASEEEESRDDSDVTESQELNKSSSSANTFVAEDGTVRNQLPTHHQTPSHDVVRQRSGPEGPLESGPDPSTKNFSIRDTFKCIFSDEMIDVILRHTNTKAKRFHDAYNNHYPTRKQLEWTDVTAREFDAFLGLLITSGVNNTNEYETLQMWKGILPYPLYRASMDKYRFKKILRYLRVDDENTRKERQLTDKATAIRNLWTMLNSNLQKYYRPTKNLTVGEQLSCRGRIEITQHIPTKYRIKVWWICDAENYYPLTGQIYTEEASTESTCRESNEGERAVMDLVVPYKESGRNITMDNFFTLKLANDLLSCKLTIVGTLKKDEPDIPPQMAPSDSLQISSRICRFQENVTICSYKVKRKKTVVLLSTMHHDIATSEEDPEIVNFFNKTKSAVDEMDKLLSQYTTCRKTDTWPLPFFYNILDIAAFAAYIIYMANNDKPSNGSNARSIFLLQLGEELCLPMIQHRSQNVQMMRNFSLRSSIECMLERPVDIIDETTLASTSTATIVRDQARRTKIIVCYICRIEEIRNPTETRKACVDCIKPICDEHSKTFNKCKICLNKLKIGN